MAKVNETSSPELRLRGMKLRVKRLTKAFSACVVRFNKKRLFTGPSLYFHLRTIQLRRGHDSVAKTIGDSNFIECLYATLTAWGMHRMGVRGAQLVDFTTFKACLVSRSDQIQRLENKTLADIRASEMSKIASELWNIMSRLKIGRGRAKLVVGSKALHHILPDLIPPIDREYTLRFFYGRKQLKDDGREEFMGIFPHLCQIAAARKNEIEGLVLREIDVTASSGMNTCTTKVIDNAIVGSMLDSKSDGARARSTLRGQSMR